MPKRDGLKSAAGEYKRGALHSDEKAYMRANGHVMPVEDICKALNRSPEVVKKFIADHVPPPKAVTPAEVETAERVTIRQELRNSETWKALKEEFFTEELKFFEEGYLKMMSQMGRDGVLATEETQVFHAVKYEVLMSRNLKQRKIALTDIERIEDMQRDFLAQFGGDVSQMDDSQKEFSLNLETQLNVARQSEKALTGEYAKLQERHADLMKQLKSTRDQRIKQIEGDNKNGYLSVIKWLSARDVQEAQGRQMELIKLAGQKEYHRLGQPVAYEDGEMDNPILSAETVDLGPEGEAGVESSDDSED